ncbi:MAG: heme-degrading monooxygenase HmoA [Myxococcota bacterium]|jgi:heme-degrading monooxygenase HmoA
MVIEIAVLPVEPAAEAELAAALASGSSFVKRQPGYRKMSWGRRVEPELAYVLMVEWDDIQDHYNFRETSDYVEFGTLFRQYLSGTPSVFHFEPHGD